MGKFKDSDLFKRNLYAHGIINTIRDHSQAQIECKRFTFQNTDK